MLRRLAVLYALAVALMCPTTLHADDVLPAEGPTTAATGPNEPTAQPAPQPSTSPAPAPAQAPAPASAPAVPPPVAVAAKPQKAKSEPVAVAAAAGSVSIVDFSFNPATVTVNVGDSVTWTNNGSAPHNAVGNGVNTKLLQKGQSDSQTFSSAGTFSYICTVHPQMKGTVKVVAASSGGGGSSSGGSSGGSASASGSGSSSGSAGSSSGGSSTATSSSGSTLPATGIDAWLLAAIGVVMLGAGIGLRDRARAA